MKFETILNKLLIEQKLTHEEHLQLVNYIDNSQDWNMQTQFQAIITLKFGGNWRATNAQAIMRSLIGDGFVNIIEEAS